jgi:hypothetical protein
VSGEVYFGTGDGSDPGGWRFLGAAGTDGLVLRDDDGRDLPPLEGLAGKSVTVRMPLTPGTPAAFVDINRLVIHGVLRQCEACRAPAVDPWPKDWRMEIAVPSPGHRPELTPHRPDCTAPRPEAMLPGLRVYDASPPKGLPG